MNTITIRSGTWSRELDTSSPYYTSFLARNAGRAEINVDWGWLPEEWEVWETFKKRFDYERKYSDDDSDDDDAYITVNYSKIKRIHLAMLDLPERWYLAVELDGVDLQDRVDIYEKIGRFKSKNGSLIQDKENIIYHGIHDLIVGLHQLVERLPEEDQSHHQYVLEGAYSKAIWSVFDDGGWGDWEVVLITYEKIAATMTSEEKKSNRVMNSVIFLFYNELFELNPWEEIGWPFPPGQRMRKSATISITPTIHYNTEINLPLYDLSDAAKVRGEGRECRYMSCDSRGVALENWACYVHANIVSIVDRFISHENISDDKRARAHAASFILLLGTERTLSLVESIEEGKIERGDEFYTLFSLEVRSLINAGYREYIGKKKSIASIIQRELAKVLT